MAKSSNQSRTLIEKIDTLPPEQQVEVEDFVDFLANKQRRRAALERSAYKNGTLRSGNQQAPKKSYGISNPPTAPCDGKIIAGKSAAPRIIYIMRRWCSAKFDMSSLSVLVDSLCAGINSPSGMWPLRNIGVISCYNTLYIQHVSLFEPCVVVVLSGRKTIFGLGEPLVCAANSAIAVPGPASFDVRNEIHIDNATRLAALIPLQRMLDFSKAASVNVWATGNA